MNNEKNTDFKNKKIVAFAAIVIGFFMTMLDTTIVNIALPKITESFNTNVQDITWISNGFNIALAVIILTASRLGDQFGRKKLFLLGLFVFTLTSLLEGFSNSLEMLIVLRVVQGLSAGIMVPLTIPLSVEIFSVEKFGAIVGIWGAVGGCASACGPGLGGLLTNTFSWQAVFFVNVPFGVISFILSAMFLKESFDETATKSIDFLGIITSSISMLTLILGLIQAPDKGWNSIYILILFTVSIILFIIIEVKVKEPMLPMQLLQSKYFTGASVTMIFMTAGMMAGSFLVSFFLIRIMKLSVLDAGLTIIAMPVTMVVLSLVAGPISHKIGARLFAILDIILASLSVYLFGTLDAGSSRLDVMWRLAVCGAGVGMSMSPLMASVVRNAPRDKVGIASGVANVSRTIGMVLGVAVLATLLNHNMNNTALSNYVVYDNTFKTFSFMLIFGIIFPMFSDKPYKGRKKQ
ncbi:multidrug resistance protein Stp [Clostridium ragsdalei P11]|uniref:Multidrug resistance protein Stp n=1 Tax=Clostridium ragsdalei P11 TaxID=1353534 RepID=A0A1A6AVP1_9CLOT|nr:MFS transporter [Clostridium ragsdalei]OBR94156.1 multidrug resistance protein Stp [Clostridium ragsdalei P11]